MTPPEVCLAQRLIDKYDLVPPINVRALVRRYAELIECPIPFKGVDGLSLYLKTPGRRPKVVINANNPATRLRFTLAHELGHILIPWHMGSFVDCLDETISGGSTEYWRLENEANSFAAELLMPTPWVNSLIEREDNVAHAHKAVAEDCDVSPYAAAIRLCQVLPPNLTYAIEFQGEVEYAGRSAGTLATVLDWRKPIPADAYAYATKTYSVQVKHRRFRWWQLPSTVDGPIVHGDWRPLLSSIVDSLGLTPEDSKSLKASISGVIAYANGSVKRAGTHTVNNVVAACIQKFHGREEYAAFYQHPDFSSFIALKARSLVEPNDD